MESSRENICTDKTPSPCWVATCNGHIPLGASVGMVTKHFGAAHVARAQHEGNWLPGVLIASYGHCLVTSNGVQHRKYQYQVLCNAGETWTQMHEDLPLPRDVLPVGYTEQDGELFVGRVCIQGATVMGKVLKRDKKCYIYYKKAESCYSEFEILNIPIKIQYGMTIRNAAAPIVQNPAMPAPQPEMSLVPTQQQKFKIDRRQNKEIAGATKAVQDARCLPAPETYLPPSHPRRLQVTQYQYQQNPYRVVPLVQATQLDTRRQTTWPSTYQNSEPRNLSSWRSAGQAAAAPRAIAIPRPEPQVPLPTLPERWVASSKGKVPPGAVVGGKNHLGAIYVARARHDGATVPGKLIPSYSKCYVTWQGQEVRKSDYEVLCDATASWELMSSQNSMPANAVKGGQSGDGSSTFYIGRIAHGGSITCGKVDSATKKCCVLFGGVEHTYDDYELLVTGDPRQAVGAAVYRVPAVVTSAPSTPKPAEQDFKLVPLSSTDKDYLDVSQRMQSTIKSHPGVSFTKYEILKMERIWNKSVWKRFMHCRERVMQENNKNANEKELFHGSPKCQEIAKGGFDERHSSTSGMFGAGVYFAEHSSKSNQYAFGLHGAGCAVHRHGACASCPREMLLCRVILGKVKEHSSANTSYAHAPPGHHSVKGTPGGGLNYPEYIVYRGEQAFPKFLITYKIGQ